MLARSWIVIVCLQLLPLLAISQEVRSFDKEAFNRMGDAQKIEVLKKTDFNMPTARSNAVECFTLRWDSEQPPVVTAFCQAMGKAKVQEAIPVLVKHMDFRYIENMDAERPRTTLEGRVALDALVQIGSPALDPAAQHIVARLSKSEDRHDIHFLCEALGLLVSKSLGETEARAYVRKLIDEQKGEQIRRYLETVEGRL